MSVSRATDHQRRVGFDADGMIRELDPAERTGTADATDAVEDQRQRYNGWNMRTHGAECFWRGVEAGIFTGLLAFTAALIWALAAGIV